MRIASLCVSLLLLLIGMGACSSGPALSRATGFAYEVVVVMDQEVWNGPAGEAVKSELASDVPGLPQYEPSLKITYVPPKDFSGLFEYVRNILVVTIDSTRYTKVSLGYENDVWARGQVVLTMRAPNAKSIVEFSETNKNALVDFFVKEEIDRAVGQLKEEYSSVVMENLKSNLDVELNAPANFIYYKDTTDFFWSSNNATTGRMDLVVYTFPYTDPDTFTADYLVAKRDSVMKANLPGGHPGSYMQTEKRAGVEYEPITLQDKYWGYASISGQDVDAASVRVKGWTKNKTLINNIILNYNRKTVQVNGEKCGYGQTWGKLSVTYDGITKTITATD